MEALLEAEKKPGEITCRAREGRETIKPEARRGRVSPNNFAIFTANNRPSIANGRYVNYDGV